MNLGDDAFGALRDRPGHPTDAAQLLGVGPGRRVFRVLHPAADAHTQDGRELVSWQDTARRTGRRIDPSRATWFDASGSRLHHPRPDFPVGAEPVAGPTPDVLVPLLRSLAPTDQPVRFAEWTGYDERLAGRDLVGATTLGAEVLRGRRYTLWLAGSDRVAELVAAEVGDPPADRAVMANYLFAPTWIVCADVDLASSYVAVLGEVPEWDDRLEVVPLAGVEPLS